MLLVDESIASSRANSVEQHEVAYHFNLADVMSSCVKAASTPQAILQEVRVNLHDYLQVRCWPHQQQKFVVC
jgi:hypothetical protein